MFRKEAIAQHTDRLSGDVAIAVPVAWQSIGYLVFGGVAAAIAFLSFADYARVEIVTGAIIPEAGVSTVVPSRNGVVASLAVREGQMVAVGQTLAAIRSEEDNAAGSSTAAQVGIAIAQQDASLAQQTRAALAAAQAQQGQIAAQRSGLAAEIAQLESQISLQRELVKSAEDDLRKTREVAERGFISIRDLRLREETLLSRRQNLSALTQSIASRRATLVETGRSASQVLAQAQAQSAGFSATRAQVAQQAADAEGSRSYVLRASVAGRVTALTARVGQPAGPQASLMTIVPSGSKLQAELAAPSAAIGFIKPGQTVRLAIDAFPYQRFGTVSGKVETVATSAVARQAANGAAISIYPVMVSLDRTRVAAFGRQEPLVSGMSLTARIVTENQSLIEWLFEPLLAVRNR